MKQGTMNILFFPLKTKVLKNGEAPILLRVTIDGQYDEVRIQRSVYSPQHFQTRANHPGSNSSFGKCECWHDRVLYQKGEYSNDIFISVFHPL